MATRTTTLRGGQVALPIEILRALHLDEGDRLTVEQVGERVVLSRAVDVVTRTAGILSKYRLPVPLTPEQERAAFEEAVALEVVGSDES